MADNESMDYSQDEVIPNSQSQNRNLKRSFEEDETNKSKVTNNQIQDRHDKLFKSDKTTNQEEEPTFTFSDDNKGPYGVWIKKKIEYNKPLSGFLAGSLIYKTYRSVVSIKNKNRFKVEVIFKNREEANRFLKDKLLEKKNLVAFVPGHHLTRKGIVRFVPLELSIEELIEGTESDVKILEISRLNRRNKQNKD